MKTSTMIYISALFWVFVSIFLEQYTASAVFLVGHILFWQNHNLEVKVNKMLEHYGIFVARYELEE